MRDKLYIYEDTNLISKKFWTYVKRASKSNRIHEILTCGSTISSDTKTKADMFNKYFYEQFSEPSMYDTDICFSTYNEFDIDFNPSRIKALLDAINTNKACGPDEIPGIVFFFIKSRPLEASMDNATYCDNGRSYLTKLKLSQ